ncbi:MAG: AMP-binding protein [Sulfurovaceae bacterium]|nr:AMP-binding protein [Sulfurovaceae bacterium]MDD5548510.1 AMP-binding protein [Sulfurovaceae bacterium]
MANIIFIDQNNNTQTQEIYLDMQNTNNKNSAFTVPDNSHKVTQLYEITKSITDGNIPILFDDAMSSSRQKGLELSKKTVFEYKDELKDAIAILFTSGTSGNPIGTVKTKDNIIAETQVHLDWLKNYKFEQCLVTVPFFHIYGFLFGVSIPLAMNLDIVTKEHFLPHEIIDICTKKPTLCITSPVFIRSMLRTNNNVSLEQTIFICSSGALESFEAEEFEKLHKTTLVQLYGSTETGGIAIRRHNDIHWHPLKNISLHKHNEGLLQVSSPFISPHIYNNGLFTKNSLPFTLSDIIELEKDKFSILGRSGEIAKLGGKRLSLIEIEKTLESINGIDEALVQIEYSPKKLRGETLTLFLVGDETKAEKSTIKKLLHEYFGGIHIENKITFIDSIPKTAIGKKVRVPFGIKKV